MVNLWDVHRSAADVAPDAIAVVDQQGGELTHAELSVAAARTSGGLAGLGLDPGSLIGAFLPNRLCWPILALGCAHRGVGVVGLNTRFREAELDYLTELARIDVAVVPHEFLGVDTVDLWRGLKRPITLVVTDAATNSQANHSWAEVTAAPIADPQGCGEHPLMGFTTSGTTGFPKVAMHDGNQTVSHVSAVIDTFGFNSDTVALVPLPLCGAFGYAIAMSVLCAGGTVVLHETWDPETAVTAMIDHGVTFFAGGDLMIIDVTNVASFPLVTTWVEGTFADFANSGREAVAVSAERSNGRVQLSGVYGSSEGFALMSQWPLDASAADRSRGGGYVVSEAMNVRCCDPESGTVLAHGEQGELHFCGPNMITEYLNNPEATAKAFGQDGWYRSGDLGYTVEPHSDGRAGFVFLSRLGDSLRLRGFLCDPAEIEHHLESHPAVRLAQVVGAQREGEGDVAVAFVQRAPDAVGLDADALTEHCRNGLANYKRPAHIEFVEDFPVTDGPNGVKIRKVELRDRAAAIVAGPPTPEPSRS